MNTIQSPHSFLGRHNEMAALKTAYESNRSEFFPIYGRRRVGKSELILQFIKPHQGLYFLGKKSSAENQIREFLEVAAETLKEPLLATHPANNWKSAIELVVSRWPKNRKMIFVFDEFQWTVEKSPELPSLLQEQWDRSWQKQGNIFLILCGSFIGFMEREVLGKKSPLFGRRTGQIFLKPFGFQEAGQFHPHYSVGEKAMTYFICGGIPLYLRTFKGELSVIQNIENAILSEFSPLYREPDFLLREELREIEKYYLIMMTLASGSKPSRDIARMASIGDRSLHYYLQNLVELGYVSRQHPLGGSQATRHVRHVLSDPLLRFWFRFVFPNTSLIAQMGPQKSMSHLIKPQLDSYFGSRFEALCREALPLIYANEKMSSTFDIGQYWDKNVQIDVVGQRADGWIDLGECKWGSVRSPQMLEKELMNKLEHYPNSKNATLQPRLFVRELTQKNIHSAENRVKWYGLKDLYSL